jgi:hypothetical protein
VHLTHAWMARSKLRLLGFTNIAEGTRWARDDFTHPLIALGLSIWECAQPLRAGDTRT